MPLAESYTFKPKSIPAYFDALLDARPPERFSIKFLENLGFTSTNDRLFVGILKDLGFLNRDGVPQQRYFDFLDRPQSKMVLAEGIRDAFSDLFAINTKANEYTVDQAKNKLRTLFAGKKTDLVIGHIAKTFKALCDYADFSKTRIPPVNSRPKKWSPLLRQHSFGRKSTFLPFSITSNQKQNGSSPDSLFAKLISIAQRAP
jgi:hypothetical protein